MMVSVPSLSAVPSSAIEVWINGSNINYIDESDAFSQATATPKGTITELFSGSVVVPPDFLGLNFHPTTVIGSPALSLPNSIWRTQDSGVHWPQVETSPGVYNWARLDEIVSICESKGWDVYHGLTFTPEFYASDLTKYDPYNRRGGGSSPNVTGWSNYVSATVARYGSRIKYYETWNEPNYQKNATVGDWFGTTAQLVELARIAYDVIKAANPLATVLSPPFFSESTGPAALSDFLTAGGGAYCDAIAHHFYLNYNHDWTYIPTYVNSIRAIVSEHGLSLPVWNAEFGNQEVYLPINGGKIMTWQDRLVFMQRSAVMTAISGAPKLLWYSATDPIDPDGRCMGMYDEYGYARLVGGWGYVHSALSGATITRVNKLSSGRLAVVASTGNWLF